MNTSFKILFMLEVLHDFYKGGACTDFKFIPTETTKQLLANYKALYKTVGNKLIVLLKVDENGKPFIQPKAEDKFCFYMELMNPLFMTISGMDSQSLSGRRFYFANLHQNKVNDGAGNDVLYLSKTIQPYQPAPFYNPGDFVKHNDVVYECIKLSPGGNTPGANSVFWISREKSQYAASTDLVQFITKHSVFPLAPDAASAQINIFKLNLANNLFDEQVMRQTIQFESAVKEVPVDLSILPEAKYRILINGKEFFVYSSNDAVYSNMFAVVELFNHLPNGNDFAFFLGNPDDGKLKDRLDVATGKNIMLTYTIRFANRLAFWKYVTPKKGVQSIDALPDHVFDANTNPADFFISKVPIALKEKPYEFKLNLFRQVSREPPLAPNPDIHASGMLTKTGQGYYCNIYLNY